MVSENSIIFSLPFQAMQSVDTGSQVCNLAWSKHSSELVSTHGYSQNQILVWKYPSLVQVSFWDIFYSIPTATRAGGGLRSHFNLLQIDLRIRAQNGRKLVLSPVMIWRAYKLVHVLCYDILEWYYDIFGWCTCFIWPRFWKSLLLFPNFNHYFFHFRLLNWLVTTTEFCIWQWVQMARP